MEYSYCSCIKSINEALALLFSEFKEAVTRYGTDIKQKIVDSFKSTWAVINDFARAHKSEAKPNSMEEEVKSEMDQMMSHLAQQHSEDDRGCEYLLASSSLT